MSKYLIFVLEQEATVVRVAIDVTQIGTEAGLVVSGHANLVLSQERERHIFHCRAKNEQKTEYFHTEELQPQYKLLHLFQTRHFEMDTIHFVRKLLLLDCQSVHSWLGDSERVVKLVADRPSESMQLNQTKSD